MNANETSVQHLCVCVCVLASTGSSLAVPPRQGKNQSARQPSNTFHLLRYLSLAIPVCARVCPVILSTSVSPSSHLPVVLFVCLSSCLVPRCLFCVHHPASNLLLSILNLSVVTPTLKNDSQRTNSFPFCYLSVSSHILIPNYLPLLLLSPAPVPSQVVCLLLFTSSSRQ